MGRWTGIGTPGVRRAALIAGVLLAFAPAGSASAQTGMSFAVAPNPPMEDGTTAFAFQGPSYVSGSNVEWDLNGNGSYETTGRTVTREYTSPGTVTVRMRIGSYVVTRSLAVQADPGPTAAFTALPAVPLPGEQVTFSSTSRASQGAITASEWDLDDDGRFDDGTGAVARRSFAARGSYTVRLRVRQTNGKTAVRELAVRVNAPPSADFAWSPAAPVAGSSVELSSSSADADGALTLSWDLDGDGLYGDASGAQVRQPFAAAGSYDVGLRATDSDGVARTVRRRIVVLAPPPAPAQPQAGEGIVWPSQPGAGAKKRPRLMSPFPVVRIAGVVLRDGALVRILSVRAPRGARVTVRCKGESCPAGVVARTSARRVVRIARFERRLEAGTRLELFVRKRDRIGKYTRFVIRAGKPPKRVDRCLFPGKRRPARCP